MNISCPECQQNYEISEDLLGETVECECGCEFEVSSSPAVENNGEEICTGRSSSKKGRVLLFTVIGLFICCSVIVTFVGIVAFNKHKLKVQADRWKNELYRMSSEEMSWEERAKKSIPIYEGIIGYEFTKGNWQEIYSLMEKTSDLGFVLSFKNPDLEDAYSHPTDYLTRAQESKKKFEELFGAVDELREVSNEYQRMLDEDRRRKQESQEALRKHMEGLEDELEAIRRKY